MKVPAPEAIMKEKPKYQKIIGSINYIAFGTRPDVAYTVNYLSRLTNCSTIEDFNKAKKALTHLNQSKNVVIKIGPVTETVLI